MSRRQATATIFRYREPIPTRASLDSHLGSICLTLGFFFRSSTRDRIFAISRYFLDQFDTDTSLYSNFTDHPNVKCYFGHGGLLGLSEGVQSGVPMVLMPFFGDQYQNSMAAKARGVAVMLDFMELTEETTRHALDEVFNNTRYVSPSLLYPSTSPDFRPRYRWKKLRERRGVLNFAREVRDNRTRLCHRINTIG